MFFLTNIKYDDLFKCILTFLIPCINKDPNSCTDYRMADKILLVERHKNTFGPQQMIIFITDYSDDHVLSIKCQKS